MTCCIRWDRPDRLCRCDDARDQRRAGEDVLRHRLQDEDDDDIDDDDDADDDQDDRDSDDDDDDETDEDEDLEEEETWQVRPIAPSR